MSSFLSFFRLVDLVLGSVLLDRLGARMLEVERLLAGPGLVTPVRIDPFLDMDTELREALELDLLRFSLELVGCCLLPILGSVAVTPDLAVFRTLRIFSADL